MSKYKITFAKRGYMIFTSHLDMQRLFKRAFKRAGISLAYSQGYNPHPLTSFAQPLSLGYYSEGEILEFRTKEDHSPSHIMSRLSKAMPEGLVILDISRMGDKEKTIASRCTAAIYNMKIDMTDLKVTAQELSELIPAFLGQQHIIVLKKSKKKKEPVATDIKEKIKEIDVNIVDDNFIMTMLLDAGSNSNLSPELFFQAFNEFSGACIPRESVDITRIQLIYQ